MTKFVVVKGRYAYYITKSVQHSFLFWEWTSWEKVKRYSGVGTIMETRWFNTFEDASKYIKYLRRQERKKHKRIRDEY